MTHFRSLWTVSDHYEVVGDEIQKPKQNWIDPFVGYWVSICGCIYLDVWLLTCFFWIWGCRSVVVGINLWLWTSIYWCTALNRVQEPHCWRPENRPPAVMSGAIYLDVRCNHAPVAYWSGGGWGSQQAAWSNVNLYFFLLVSYGFFSFYIS